MKSMYQWMKKNIIVLIFASHVIIVVFVIGIFLKSNDTFQEVKKKINKDENKNKKELISEKECFQQAEQSDDALFVGCNGFF